MATTIMSPSNLELLLHYHCCPVPHERTGAPAIEAGILYLVNEGMLEKDDRLWRTTDKGKFYIAHLLKIPFPVMTYEIPPI